MSTENGEAHASPSWFVGPGESDHLVWVALAIVCLAIYGVITLYAAFDRWAEHKSQGTPLAKTIPTLLTIALLYEIFPLGHFSILLPISAILIALMADWSRFNLHVGHEAAAEPAAPPMTASPEEPEPRESPDPESEQPDGSGEQPQNV